MNNGIVAALAQPSLGASAPLSVGRRRDDFMGSNNVMNADG